MIERLLAKEKVAGLSPVSRSNDCLNGSRSSSQASQNQSSEAIYSFLSDFDNRIDNLFVLVTPQNWIIFRLFWYLEGSKLSGRPTNFDDLLVLCGRKVMDGTQLLDVVERYDALLERMGVEVLECDHAESCVARGPALSHVRSMVPQMREMVAAGKLEKAFRWLGWMQGVLWSFGVYTLEEERDHNRAPS